MASKVPSASLKAEKKTAATTAAAPPRKASSSLHHHQPHPEINVDGVDLPDSIVDALGRSSATSTAPGDTDLQMRIRRSRSIGNLDEYRSQLQRFGGFVWELPGKIRSQHRLLASLPRRLSQRHKKFAAEKVSENKLGDVGPQLPVDPVVLAVCIFPFVPLWLYALFTVALSTIFAYLGFLLLYLLVLGAFVVCEVAIRPPWYKPTTPEQGLTTEQLPSYWQGICHNPKYDLNLDYEDVQFKNEAGLVLREHGTSDGTKRGFSFGIREQYDVMTAVRFMKQDKGLPRVVVLGTSVGGSSAIMAAANDNSIDGVIAENPVACVEEFALFHLKRMISAYAPKAAESIWLKPFYTLVSRILLMRIGAPLGYTRPYEVIEGISPRPVMLMHGTADDLVPIDHSTRLHTCAANPKYLWLAKDAWHCALYDQHPEEYAKRIYEFLDLHFSNKEEQEKKETESVLVAEEPKNEEAAAHIQEVSDELTAGEGTTTVTTEKEARMLREAAGDAVQE